MHLDRAFKSTVFNSFNKMEKKRKKTYIHILQIRWSWNIRGSYYCLMPKIGAGYRSPCPEPMCVIYFHFTRERGSFFLAIITKFCHIQGSLGDRETESVVFVETVIWSANFGCVPNVCFPRALHKLTICHWFLCPLTIPDQTRWRSKKQEMYKSFYFNYFISTQVFLWIKHKYFGLSCDWVKLT